MSPRVAPSVGDSLTDSLAPPLQMPQTRKGPLPRGTLLEAPEDCELTRFVLDVSPLKPAELQILRAQYEKEGDYVGIQTKFNYAWVWSFQRFTYGAYADQSSPHMRGML